MREVERLCTRIAIVHRGRILAEGSLAQLHAEHQHEDFEDVFLDLVTREEQRLAEQLDGQPATLEPIS